MFQAGDIQAFGARHQHLFNVANAWFGPSVEWHVGHKGVTLVAIGEAFGDIPAGEVRVGVWENKPYVGAEAGVMQGGSGTFFYLYRSHDFAFSQQGREHDVSDALFVRVGSPNAGIIVQVDRTLTNFLFCFDFRLFFPLSHGVMFRLGFRPMLRLVVRDKELFTQGFRQFLGGRERQQAVLNQLADFARERDNGALGATSPA
jgi:hypothetical protein